MFLIPMVVLVAVVVAYFDVVIASFRQEEQVQGVANSLMEKANRVAGQDAVAARELRKSAGAFLNIV